MPILSIRVPAELHESFVTQCERRGLAVPEVHRRAIEAITEHMARADLTASIVPVITDRTAPKRLDPAIRGFATDGSGALKPHGPRPKK